MKAANSGENNGRVKLTTAQVAEIKRAYSAGGVTQAKLAREYGVTQSQIGRIVTSQNWNDR